MKTLKTRLVGTLAALLLLPVLAAAAPLLINYQGRLVDTTGNPLVGTQSILFSVYDAASGGTLLWSETQSVTPDNGIFAVSLGGVTPLPASVFGSDARYLEIKIGSDSPMSPRTRLLSTPYALYTANLGSSGTQATISTDTVVTGSQLRLGNYTTSGIPGSIGEGSIIYDSTVKQIKFWNNTSWSPLQSGGVSPWSSAGSLVYLGDNNNNVGVGTAVPLYKLHVSSGAGEAGVLMAVSTGTANIFTVNGLGEVRANKFYGDGSALTGIVTTDKVLKTGDTMTGALTMNASPAFNTATESAILIDTNVVVNGQLKVGAYASAPDATALGAGSIYYKNGDTLYVSNGATWTQLAAGGASPWSSSGGATTLVTPSDNVGVGKVPSYKLDVAGSVRADYAVIAASMVVTSNSPYALSVAGGITAGSGNVAIVDTTGKVPALTSTYFASLDGSKLTGVITSTDVIVADLGTKAADSAVVHLAGDTMTGALTMNNVNLNLTGASGKIVSQSSITTSGGFFGDGSGLSGVLASGVAAANVAAGSLGANVIVSSIAVNAVHTAAIPDSAVTTAKLAGSITDDKLSTISTAGKVSNSATTATSANTNSAIVARDASGNFSAGTITASSFSGPLSGNVTGNVTGNADTASAVAASGVSAGSLGASVIASSIAVNGVYGAAIKDAAVTDAKINDVAGSKITGAGSIATSLIAAGSLGSSVIASSIAVNGVYTDAIADLAVTDAKINDVAGSKITGAGSIATDRIAAGSLGANVIASSIAVNGVYTDAVQDLAVTNAKINDLDASKLTGSIADIVTAFSDPDCDLLTPTYEGQFCYDLNAHVLTVSTSTQVGGFASIPVGSW